MKRYVPIILLSLVVMAGLWGVQQRQPASNPVHAVSQPALAYAHWASSATTVADLTAEADLIVRVTVEAVHPARPHVLVLEPDSRGTGGEAVTQVTPFTDSEMRVVEVYKGSVGEKLTVMQTGGAVPATAQYAAQNMRLAGDPLFAVGGEHILFLQDISGDSVHAPNRQLFIVVHPAGRYDVVGDGVVNPYFIEEQAVGAPQGQRFEPDALVTATPFAEPTEAPVPGTEPDPETSTEPVVAATAVPFTPPGTLTELEQQILQALARTE